MKKEMLRMNSNDMIKDLNEYLGGSPSAKKKNQ